MRSYILRMNLANGWGRMSASIDELMIDISVKLRDYLLKKRRSNLINIRQNEINAERKLIAWLPEILDNVEGIIDVDVEFSFQELDKWIDVAFTYRLNNDDQDAVDVIFLEAKGISIGKNHEFNNSWKLRDKRRGMINKGAKEWPDLKKLSSFTNEYHPRAAFTYPPGSCLHRFFMIILLTDEAGIDANEFEIISEWCSEIVTFPANNVQDWEIHHLNSDYNDQVRNVSNGLFLYIPIFRISRRAL